MAKEEVTGIILSGGKSNRLGHEKGLAEFNGKPLVVYALNTLKPLCDRVLISANNCLDEYAALGFEVVEDEIKGIGPMGGLLSCLKRSSSRFNFILSCDTPFVPGRLFVHLLDSIENFQVAVPVHGDNYTEPLCAVYSTNVIWEMQRCIDRKEYKLSDFLEKVNAKKVLINDRLPFYREEMFVNMNTKTDLESNSGHGNH